MGAESIVIGHLMRAGTVLLASIVGAISSSGVSEAGDKSFYEKNGTYCYGDPFSASATTSNYCFGNLGLWGTPALASGGQWGRLSLFNYMGNVEYRGPETTTCEARLGGSTYTGRFLNTEKMPPSDRFNTKDGIVDGEDATYCVFAESEAVALIEAVWTKSIVHMRVEGYPDKLGGFDGGVSDRENLAEFVQVVDKYLSRRLNSHLRDPTQRTFSDKLYDLLP